jgi:gliding motility-associated-like protein
VTYNWTVGNESISNSNPISVPGSITSTNGQYTVTVIASIGSCTNSASNTLTVNPLPTLSILNPTVTTCENTEAQFDVLNASSNNTYQWYNSGQNISSGTSLSIKSVNESNAGTYTVTVTDANGCIASAIGLLVIDECDTFIPEIFTPNGDGKNDGFEIKNIKKYPKNNLKIFNRWGNLVYQKDAYNNEFEGYANEGNAVGKGKLPAGTYYIVLDYGDGKTKVYNGILQLQY